MKRPIISNFLCLTSLKIGAYIIAGFSVICSAAIIGGYSYKIFDIFDGSTEESRKGQEFILSMVVLSINIAYGVAWIAAAVFLYLGAKQYNCKKLIFMLIMLALGIIRVILIVIYDPRYYEIVGLSQLDIFNDDCPADAVNCKACDYCAIMQIVNIIFGAIFVYFFVCVANLYKMLKDEAIVVITKKINITI